MVLRFVVAVVGCTLFSSFPRTLHATDNGPAPSQKNNTSIGGGDEGEEEEDKEEKKEQSWSTMILSFFSSLFATVDERDGFPVADIAF